MSLYNQNFKKPNIKAIGLVISVCRFVFWNVLILIVFPWTSFAQSPTDFSGKWILDNTKSSSLYSGVASVLNLTQSENIIDIKSVIIQGDSEPTNLSGKYTIGNPREGKDTLKTCFSDDKQSFSILEVKGETRILRVYTLKQDGKMLEINSDETLTGGFIRHTILVYNKVL